MSNVRGYGDEELLNKVKSLSSFKNIPKNYWILGLQSNEDAFNKYDDKFYLFKGEEFIMVTTGTTNAGKNGLKQYGRYNKEGFAAIKTNEWFYGLWKFGKHRGKMDALRQVKPIKYYRDGDGDDRVEEVGKMREAIIGINFHTNTYNKFGNGVKELIGGWSLGCQVCNQYNHYRRILDYVEKQSSVSYCLLKEF